MAKFIAAGRAFGACTHNLTKPTKLLFLPEARLSKLVYNRQPSHNPTQSLTTTSPGKNFAKVRRAAQQPLSLDLISKRVSQSAEAYPCPPSTWIVCDLTTLRHAMFNIAVGLRRGPHIPRTFARTPKAMQR